jgi:glycosyltransferase involved in cell wall biosynthesis
MISVVLATHNEEKNISKCLASVKNFADEIIVVDGDSTDQTRALAKKLGARVIKTSNKANFHINKQLAMDEAKGQLVLQLDADEAVDEELAAFIKETAKKISKKKQFSSSDTVAWWIRRRNLFMGRWLKKGGQYPDPVIRLYVKGKAGLPQKDVHEQMWVDGQTAMAQGHLWHYSNPTFSDYLRKFNTYTSLKAEQLKDHGLKVNPLTFINHAVIKPMVTFLKLYIRHKGFMDAWPGFVFALFSGLHHLVAYLKFWELKRGEA